MSLAETPFPCRLLGVGLALVLFIVLPGLAHPFGVAKESVIALVSAFALFVVATGPAHRIRPWPWWWTLLLLAPAGVMTAAALANGSSALASDGPVRLWCYAVFFLSARLACPTTADTQRLVQFATALGGIEGALVVVQVVAGHLAYDWSGIPSAKWKAFGTLGNPNWVGAYLAATLPLAVARLHAARGRSACTHSALLVSMTFAGLALTLSRGAWIAAASGLGALAVLDRSRAWRRTVLTMAAVLPLTVAIAWVNFGGGELRQALLRQASVTGRLRIWESSLTMVAARPMLGWGPGQFAGAYPAFQRVYVQRHGADPRITELTDHPHSEYLYFAAEGGGLALLAVLAVTGLALGWGARGPADSVG
ncbi:MAG: putative bicarbonate transporter, IctB family, partial [Deltaproteobacteria bacterium]|nr:putative bicarbonate transporter, IctB family [Deltaproteobacteria bacterium]